jgi:hypothetical protein
VKREGWFATFTLLDFSGAIGSPFSQVWVFDADNRTLLYRS